MTQLSRPYQIALVALGLLAAVWFFALRGHSASTTGAGASASSPAAKPAAPSTPYHGSAPGVAGLTRAIEKAHGAVAQSEQNARQLAEKSAQASSSSSPTPAAATSTASSQATRSATPTSAATTQKGASSASGAAGAKPKTAAPSMQATVEGKLKQGKVVAILFWNPKASVDQAVQSELQSVARALGGKLVVLQASARQVGSFGSFTRAVQVYQTPTILFVNPRGQATTMAGLTDVFSIEQAIGEAKR